MLKVTQYDNGDIVMVEPEGALREADFDSLDAVIDPIIAAKGKLKGFLIHAESFPGWDSFGAFLSHRRFWQEHHAEIGKVALATDSPLGSLAEMLTKVVGLRVRHFPYRELEEARAWLVVAEPS